jgi:hypothetical protein
MATKNHNKLRKRRAKQRKRRAERAGQSLVNVKPASPRLTERISRDHLDVLQNIEFAVADCYRHDEFGLIDDAAVAKALRHVLLGMPPDESEAGLLVDALRAVREFRDEVVDETWNDALRVVLASVHNHSNLARGETSYLAFVEPYVP